jgi:ABC-type glycerol-3-phosphate transport system substrate-binding protein
MQKRLLTICIFTFYILGLVGPCAAEELVFWNFWDPKFILPVIEAFEKENPGVKIRNEQITWGNGLDKIVVAMANGRAPDICEIGSTWMGKFMGEGALLDVTDKFSDLKPDYMMWEPATWQGRLYGMPWLAGTRVLFYNRQLFAEVGLNPDRPPLTWAEFLDAAKKLHDPGKGRYGFGMNAGEGHILYKKFMPFVWGNGGKILDENGQFVFDSPATREALQFYLQLKEYSYSEKQDLLDEAFKRGTLGMAISGSWNFARYPKDAPNLDFGVAVLPKPAADKGFSTSFLGGEILVLFKTCKNPDMAAKFIRFLTKAENTLPITKEALVSFPAVLSSFNDPFFASDPRLKVFFDQMKTGIHPPVHPLWIELEKIINTAVEKAMYGESADKVFAEAAAEYKRISERKENNRQEREQTMASASADPAVSQSNGGSMQITLLMLIAVGTIINAILLTFLVIEVKKNAR